MISNLWIGTQEIFEVLLSQKHHAWIIALCNVYCARKGALLPGY